MKKSSAFPPLQGDLSLIMCCQDILDSMSASTNPDLNYMAGSGVKLATSELEMWEGVERRTHAAFKTRETLEFAMRKHLTNEYI